MENAWIALMIFGAVTIGMIAQGWVSMLEHQRRRETLEVIKAALQAGREPPPQLYDMLRQDSTPKAPWSEALVFSALSFGFWLAFAFSEDDRRTVFLVIAATMTVTALACLALAIWGPARKSRTRGDDEQ